MTSAPPRTDLPRRARLRELEIYVMTPDEVAAAKNYAEEAWERLFGRICNTLTAVAVISFGIMWTPFLNQGWLIIAELAVFVISTALAAIAWVARVTGSETRGWETRTYHNYRNNRLWGFRHWANFRQPAIITDRIERAVEAVGPENVFVDYLGLDPEAWVREDDEFGIEQRYYLCAWYGRKVLAGG